jgi:UDP-N-acetylglucosamine 4,6-dehydratase
MAMDFADSVVTITGGTGSFGQAMARNLLNQQVSEVRILSRDENKQDQMRNEFNDPRLKFYIGDVRDKDSARFAVSGSEYVFHAAALKQVPSCEFFPEEAVSTNILGSRNVMDAAYETNVKMVVCLSTDKAVYPINAMGMTKALMEKFAQSYARRFPKSETSVSITRYGNVMMSRGSVIPLFIKRIIEGKDITITDPNMTRFMMSLDESVGLVQHAFKKGSSGDLFVRKAPGASIATLVEALGMLEIGKITVQNIGVRHGEKSHESLLSSEERVTSEEEGSFYKVPLDSRNLNYNLYFSEGNTKALSSVQPFTSENTVQLTPQELARIISELPEFKSLLGKKK